VAKEEVRDYRQFSPTPSEANPLPASRYRLDVVSWSPTSGWGYAEGIVQAGAASDPVATVRRNYCAFPFIWCEDHPSGHDYLVCGEDYQGQAIIELDTGRPGGSDVIVSETSEIEPD